MSMRLARGMDVPRILGFPTSSTFVAVRAASARGSPGVEGPAGGGVRSDARSLLTSAEIATAAGCAVGAGTHTSSSNALPCRSDGPPDIGRRSRL